MSAGGQKHRIALARACYAAADVVLLDDPLSAVDAHVGAHLMKECINGVLAGRTRILVTHQLQFLPEADVVVMMKGGRITHSGPYADLLAAGVTFAEFKLHASEHGDAGEDEAQESRGHGSVDGAAPPSEAVASSRHAVSTNGEDVKRAAADGDAKTPGAAEGSKKPGAKAGALTGSEDRSSGSVARQVYLTYLRAWGPGVVLPLIFLAFSGTERGLQVCSPATGSPARLPVTRECTLPLHVLTPERRENGCEGRKSRTVRKGETTPRCCR